MSRWVSIQPPFHSNKNLSIECKHEGGKGRYQLIAYDKKGNYIHGSFYPYSVWHGHCHGQLLIEDFLEEADYRLING